MTKLVKFFKSIDWSKINAGTMTRTLILLLALVNQILAFFNLSPLQISDEEVGTAITTAFTIVSAIIAWWKNNSFTSSAIKADETKANLKTKNTFN